jgi:hypothetical protein
MDDIDMKNQACEVLSVLVLCSFVSLGLSEDAKAIPETKLESSELALGALRASFIGLNYDADAERHRLDFYAAPIGTVSPFGAASWMDKGLWSQLHDLVGLTEDDSFEPTFQILGSKENPYGWKLSYSRMFRGIPVDGDGIYAIFGYSNDEEFNLVSEGKSKVLRRARSTDGQLYLRAIFIQYKQNLPHGSEETAVDSGAWAADVAQIETGISANSYESHLKYVRDDEG